LSAEDGFRAPVLIRQQPLWILQPDGVAGIEFLQNSSEFPALAPASQPQVVGKLSRYGLVGHDRSAASGGHGAYFEVSHIATSGESCNLVPGCQAFGCLQHKTRVKSYCKGGIKGISAAAFIAEQIWGIPFDVKDTKAKSRSRLNNCGRYVFHNCISGA